MNSLRIALILAVAAFAGCSKKESDSAVPPSRKSSPSGGPSGTAAVPAPPPPDPSTLASSDDTPKDLAPIQNGIAAFAKANNRLPNNVEELVEKKFIKALPPLPTGQIYYIDHATGRVKIGGGP